MKITSCKNVIWGDVRRHAHPLAIPLALTKISRIDGLPYFLTQDAPRAAAPPELKSSKAQKPTIFSDPGIDNRKQVLGLSYIV